jgi:hypothetical protein
MPACTTHASCGSRAYCDATGHCVPSASGNPCDTNDNCIASEHCTGGRCGCGGQHYGATSVPPNVLIVLDRSSSMNDPIPGGTKWTVALSAISNLVSTYDARIRFGLMEFPGMNQTCTQGMMCGPGNVFVNVAPMTGSMITTFLNGSHTCMFGTPTAEALIGLQMYSGLADPMRANYVLLITDGQSTCADPVPVVSALRARNPSIRTFVIGFGSAVDPMQLAALANAGGTARMGSPVYYQADDATSLASAFMTIAGSVLSCTYTLSDIPPDPSMLYVFFGTTSVARDSSHANGWDYDAMTHQLQFYGATCDMLRGGGVGNLVVSYGCPTPG